MGDAYVNILKGEREVRICGDFKLTVNPQLDVDQYTLPTADDLFTTLNGGQKFTKLDSRHAYEQLVFNEKSRQYVTIHTHKGLYRYKRLPYGITSAPAIFQKQMEIQLGRIPGICVFLDDVLVTAEDDTTHLERLHEVLTRRKDRGLRLAKTKCLFMQDKVDYLGHTVSGSGVSTMSKKVQAVHEAPIPKNVSELRSFLGLVNYYERFVPKLSTILKPLTLLLHEDVP